MLILLPNFQVALLRQKLLVIGCVRSRLELHQLHLEVFLGLSCKKIGVGQVHQVVVFLVTEDMVRLQQTK